MTPRARSRFTFIFWIQTSTFLSDAPETTSQDFKESAQSFGTKMPSQAEVVDPQLFGPRFFLSRFVLQEQHVGFKALSVEDAGGQAEQCVDVALRQQVLADGLSGSALEEDVVGDDDRTAAAHLHQGFDVLDEIELFVLRAP